MSNPVLATPLDEVERNFLYEQRHSEHFRVFKKAIVYLIGLEAARATVVTPDMLQNVQGRMQGLLAAQNLLVFGNFPDQEKK
jgi:hypothetical protein